VGFLRRLERARSAAKSIPIDLGTAPHPRRTCFLARRTRFSRRGNRLPDDETRSLAGGAALRARASRWPMAEDPATGRNFRRPGRS
jgi:hypothetical protein